MNHKITELEYILQVPTERICRFHDRVMKLHESKVNFLFLAKKNSSRDQIMVPCNRSAAFICMSSKTNGKRTEIYFLDFEFKTIHVVTG